MLCIEDFYQEVVGLYFVYIQDIVIVVDVDYYGVSDSRDVYWEFFFICVIESFLIGFVV